MSSSIWPIPTLTAASTAAAIGISLRQLYILFEPTGTGFARYMLRQRLLKCRDTIAGATGTGRSVADIAFGWGFGSMATFTVPMRVSSARPHRAARRQGRRLSGRYPAPCGEFARDEYRGALDETTHVSSGLRSYARATRCAEATENFVDPVEQEFVRDSFARVAMMPEVAAALFYERLFTINPSFLLLFTHDMRIQGVRLMAMLTIIVYNLHQPGETRSAIRDLAKRHVEYGVKLADYDALKDALLWNSEQVLADDLTPEIRNAWAVCYQELAGEMMSAAGA